MRRKILYVEDHPDSAVLAQRFLASRGITVVMVIDGASALERIREERPDLVLMDMQLPGVSGYEVTRQIKEDEELGRIPVIALTAYALKGDREKTLAAGCDDYLSKPVDLDRLADVVQRFLR